jgi:4-hydroxy 2-oxovalerate aldolase/long-chain acyl-CoA synthetase
MHRSNVQILECTLRDGSYVIDFQFTPKDTAVIAAALENAGFDLIEVGHGVGMNASNVGKGVAAATDEQYMQAAANTLKRAQWGMFFIPGIGRHEDLELAATYKMDFVRIGTNASEVSQSKKYVEHAKKLGMFVSANLMKSYVLPPHELAKQAKQSQEFGVDLVVLVDSAGAMLPDDVRIYIETLRNVLTVPIGLHCHDNLGLGIANALTAIDCGAQRIDSTLQGMGRGGGNPVTEVLLAVLKKKGIDLNIDINRVMDISERLIKPLLQDKGWDSINITSGYAGFHSSFLQTILKYADLYDVDPRDLIVDVCKVDQVDAPDELVENLAQQLQRRHVGRSGLHMVSLPRFSFPAAKRTETIGASLIEAAQEIAHEARTTAKKRGKNSVLNIVAARRPIGEATVSRFIQEEFDYVVGNIEVDNAKQLAQVITAVDGIVDILLVDADPRPFMERNLISEARPLVRQSKLVGYSDSDVWVRSVAYEVEALRSEMEHLPVTIVGGTKEAMKLAFYLSQRGAMIMLTGGVHDELIAGTHAVTGLIDHQAVLQIAVEDDAVLAVRQARVLIAFHQKEPVVSLEVIRALPSDAVVFDASIGSITSEAISWGVEHGIRIVRPDMRAALAGELASLLGTSRITDQLMGRGEIAGVPVVGGGLIGRKGDVVVDSVINPSRVVGIADGQGRVLYDHTGFEDRVEAVETEIARRRALLT